MMRRCAKPLTRGALAALILTLALTVAPTTGPLAGSTAAAAPGAPEIRLTHASTALRPGEAAHLRGVVTDGQRPLRRQVLDVEVRRQGSWQAVDEVTTGPRGRFLVTVFPGGGRSQYRVRVRGVPGAAVTAAVRRSPGPRTIPQRHAEAGFVVGQPRGVVRTVRRHGARVSVQRARRGLLVRVGKRTSLVHGRMLRVHRRHGGVGGRLGAPVGDQRCQLMEGACIQRFQGGSIYLNPRARHRVSVGFGRTRNSQLIAAALSQAGYTEPTYRGSKYNNWQGSREAWCGMFLAWAGRAAGLGDAVPAANTFAVQARRARQRGPTTRRPRVGQIGFLGRADAPWHAVLVVSVHGDRIRTIEGNVGRGSDGGHPRGVFRGNRSVSSVGFFFTP